MIKTLAINASGLLSSAQYIPSPHADARPDENDINLIVIHGISLPPGEFGSAHIADFFCGKLNVNDHPYFRDIFSLKVSAHLLIRRDGSVLQFVPFLKRAWHAGESVYAGRTKCNDFSIGIELEGTDTIAYTQIQYEKLIEIINALLHSYKRISRARIVGHSDIAPGRKTDPGPFFDWDYLQGNLT